jgi:D-aminopeptidase
MSKSVKDWSLNGISFGEMGLQALIAGHFGVPMVFVSGDAHACREIGELIPGIVTAAVKRGLSRRSAVSWPPQKARELIRAGIQEGLRQRDRIRPLRLDPPLVFREERYDEVWTKPSANPDIRIVDHNTREIRANDLPDFLNKLYGYPREYRAPSLADEEKR